MSFIFCALCKDTDFWNRMLASLSGTEMCPPTVPFPNELLFVLKDDAATELPPTHALTIYSSDPTRLNEYAMGITTAVVCPVHHIVLAVNCNKIPPVPRSDHSIWVVSSIGDSPVVSLPVLKLFLPAPKEFPALQNYLYSRDSKAIISHLLPAALPLCNDAQLESAKEMILGLWHNARALGVVDEKFWCLLADIWVIVSKTLIQRKRL